LLHRDVHVLRFDSLIREPSGARLFTFVLSGGICAPAGNTDGQQVANDGEGDDDAPTAMLMHNTPFERRRSTTVSNH
jgi:hypothetical protein